MRKLSDKEREILDKKIEKKEKRDSIEFSRAEALGRCISCGIYSSKKKYVQFKQESAKLRGRQIICESCIIDAGKALGHPSPVQAEKALRDKDIIFESIQKHKANEKRLEEENKELIKKLFPTTVKND